jgi:hypothetical protein
MVQRRIIALTALPMGMSLSAGAAAAETPGDAGAYVTWDVFEADKCASIWLIRRFVAPDAEIVFFSRGEAPPQGVLFDTPEARFRRYHNRSTYETLLEHYNKPDKGLTHIGRIIHDIEVNIWERKALEETRRIEKELFELLDDEAPERTAADCVDYFDALYATYR